jgi:hypothetical protein
VIERALVAEAAKHVLVEARHDVPTEAALGVVVERGHPPGEVERMVLNDRTGEDDAEVLGRRGQGRGKHGGVVALSTSAATFVQ